jgi:predicted methyltransferase
MIICGDCKEVMKRMDSDSIDAIVTDPPAEYPRFLVMLVLKTGLVRKGLRSKIRRGNMIVFPKAKR